MVVEEYVLYEYNVSNMRSPLTNRKNVSTAQMNGADIQLGYKTEIQMPTQRETILFPILKAIQHIATVSDFLASIRYTSSGHPIIIIFTQDFRVKFQIIFSDIRDGWIGITIVQTETLKSRVCYLPLRSSFHKKIQNLFNLFKTYNESK